jgi:glutamate dehydrogenase
MNQQFQLSAVDCTIDHHISAEILQILEIPVDDELYVHFINQILQYVPVDSRSEQQIFNIKNFIQKAFDFFREKGSHAKGQAIQRKIQITTHLKEHDNYVTYIFINAPSKPFLFDSLNALFEQLSLHVLLQLTPILKVMRDEKGFATKILGEAYDADAEEALIYVKISGKIEDNIAQKIQNDIEHILDLIDCTHEAWPHLVDKVIEIAENILANKAALNKYHLPTQESLEFLQWLQKDHITFLAALNFDLSGNIKHFSGIEELWQNNQHEINKLIDLSKSQYYREELILLGKLNKISPIHRTSFVDYILIKNFDKDGVYIGGTIIFGLYGSAMYFQSVKSIPILRQKMQYALGSSGFAIDSYSAKKIKMIIESLPRDMLIQNNAKDLSCIAMHILSSMSSQKTKIFIQKEWSDSFINILIFLKREKLTPEIYTEIRHYLADKFNNNILNDNITVVGQNFVYLFTTIIAKDRQALAFDQAMIEQDLLRITTDWHEALLKQLIKKSSDYEGRVQYNILQHAFPKEYYHEFSPENAAEDADHLMAASSKKQLIAHLAKGQENNEYFLKFYTPNARLILSEILPVIENLGFVAINEQSFQIESCQLFEKSWIYQFRLTRKIAHEEIEYQILKENVESALEFMLQEEVRRDALSNLITACGFTWVQVQLIKALSSYLHQTGITYDKPYVKEVLVKHYQYTKLLINLFEARFSVQDQSPEAVKKILLDCQEYLKKVDSSSEDKILTDIRLLIMAINRTNFYHLDPKGQMIKSYISFKIDSHKVPSLPEPVPYAEIFVYSNDFQAVHLSGGKVARGGIRWSDRGEDYRTEVLGLMKAQMTKNTVIVPVGSKGAFFVNFKQNGQNRDEYMNRVIGCYQNFIRGMLDLTDNIIDGKVVPPKNTVRHDGDDLYLVVAADKGTASFSDYANAVSAEYNFWLQDAFASGGSVGYDHKKMGITAKGAWISVQAHFKAKGIDVQSQPFTVVGIGDMSGDVFGNGMLLSEYIKLVAAFNHEHIFIDPQPDCKASFHERSRLFNLTRSKWSDYNPGLISQGGGVFERSAKIVNLSPEIKRLLGVEHDSMTPNELIKAILMAKVDLLWNGGIGTYIKSETQNNIDIADKANDALRINGKEVGAGVVAEGGNLGVSQLGRIEYAQHGGAINTDFIDNSGGVDCSDHEVNIKIALNMALAQKRITLQERNDLLAAMTPQVESLVLKDNYEQNLAITIAELSPNVNISAFGQLIKELEQQNLLNRELEFLPSQSQISERSSSGLEMARPEIAVLLSYSKMSLDAELSNSGLLEEEYFKRYLVAYFPKDMQQKFAQEIANHPLRADIIKTVITNKVINQIGPAVLSILKHETGAQGEDIVRAYEVIEGVFNLQNLWQQASNLGHDIANDVKIQIFNDLNKIMRRGISWFVKNLRSPIDIVATIEQYKQPIEELGKIIIQSLTGQKKNTFLSTLEYYRQAHIEADFARSVASLSVLVSALDIIYISAGGDVSYKGVTNIYFACGDLLNIDWLRYKCETQITDSLWNKLAIQSMKDDLYDKQRRLVKKILSSAPEVANEKNHHGFITKWIAYHDNHLKIFTNFIDEIKIQDNINASMLILALKKLEIIVRNIESEV